ncbi:MAG: hypothetical protein ACI8W8_005109, partial [Rhodothermales bacterium]
LAGDVGGEVENVKRWAGQVDVTMDDSAIITFLSKQKRITSEGGFSVLVIDLTSETGLDAPSALAAISTIQRHTAFIKLSGKGSVLADELENFIAVCTSLRMAEGGSAPAAEPPPAGKIAWVLPEGWSEEAGSGMRMATITPAEEGGECSIVSLAGEAGGISANITRWLEQIEVTMSEEKVLAFLETQDVLESQDGHAVMLIDMTGQVKGPDADAMIVGIARFGEKTIFLKLTGTAGYLNGQKASFKALCESLHLDGASQ